MIELRRDHLWLAQAGGEAIPCSAEELTFEIVGSGADGISPEVLRHAAAGVLHYFKEDLGQTRITLGEFAAALARVLSGFGYTIEVAGAGLDGAISQEAPGPQVRRLDLRAVAVDVGKMGELGFFPRLHSLFLQQLASGPGTVDIHGLRAAVKELLGRKHWNQDCRELETRIIETLRQWYHRETEAREAAMVVR